MCTNKRNQYFDIIISYCTELIILVSIFYDEEKGLGGGDAAIETQWFQTFSLFGKASVAFALNSGTLTMNFTISVWQCFPIKTSSWQQWWLYLIPLFWNTLIKIPFPHSSLNCFAHFSQRLRNSGAGFCGNILSFRTSNRADETMATALAKINTPMMIRKPLEILAIVLKFSGM